MLLSPMGPTRTTALLLVSICAAAFALATLPFRWQAAAASAKRAGSALSRYFAPAQPAPDTGVITPAAAGNTIAVNSTADVGNSTDGLCTLREAITAANTNTASGSSVGECAAGSSSGEDMINFSVIGTIDLTSSLPAIEFGVKINGPGANTLTVRRSLAGGTPDFRIVTINVNTMAPVTITDLTISNGNVPGGDGGGVNSNTNLTLINCNVFGNTAGRGGGVFNRSTSSASVSLVLDNCNIGGTAASQANAGGGISAAGSLTMTGGSVVGNSGGFGGGINFAGTLTLNGVAITDNTVPLEGAGIFMSSTTLNSVSNIVNCLIANNTAGREGGGIYNNSSGAVANLVNSTISGNRSGSSGGGLRSINGSVLLTNVTITNNRSDSDNSGGEQGGGIDRTFGTVTLNNTIVARNFRGASPGTTADDIAGTGGFAGSFNLIGTGGSGGLVNGVDNNQVGIADPKLGPLEDNGGRLLTHALLATSPALDMGSNSFVVNPPFSGPPFTDQRGMGFDRVVDGPDADATATVDIGAYEKQVSFSNIPDATTNEDTMLILPFEVDNLPPINSITATSDNATLVPNDPAHLAVTGSSSSSTRVLTVNPAANLSGTANITITLDTTSGSMARSFLLTVNSVNDAPSFTKGPDQNLNEDAGPQIIPNWAVNISPGPPNESGQTVSFTVTNNNNALFSTQPVISPAGTLTYASALNANGTATCSVTLRDNSGTANGGQDTSGIQTFMITVNAVNDPPVNTVPGPQIVVENGTLSFSAANTNQVSIADVDAGNGAVEVTLTATNGTITLSGTTGLSFTVGNGTGNVTMTFTGTISNVNAALNGMTYAPTAGFHGTASLQITANDQGNTGSGGAMSDTDTVNITVSNDTVQFDASSYTVLEGGGSAVITVNRTGDVLGTSTVNFATSDGSASQSRDYTVTTGTLTFNPGDTSKTFGVPIVDDAYAESSETLTLTLSNAGGATLSAPSTATLTINDNDGSGPSIPQKRFMASLDGAQETPATCLPPANCPSGSGMVLLNANETSALVGLQFFNLGSAETAAHIHTGAVGVAGPITFPLAPPITNPITDLQINPTTPQVADLKAGQQYINVHSSNFPNGEIRGQLLWNPTLEMPFFIRQHYLDFLNREPEAAGLAFWLSQINCPPPTPGNPPYDQANVQCFHDRTVGVSDQFFFSGEFHLTASFVFKAYRAAYGNTQPFPNPDPGPEAQKLPDYNVFMNDRPRVLGGTNLEQTQLAFASLFVTRPEFTSRYGAGLNTGTLFVDAVLANIQAADGVVFSSTDRQTLIDHYSNAGGGNAGRAKVMWHLSNDYWNTCSGAAPCVPAGFAPAVDNRAFIDAEYNREFALTLYFGYLRRNPEIGGFLFWQDAINQAPVRNQARQIALVCSFVTSGEYQARFGPFLTFGDGFLFPRTNAECR